jgi:hypothetical protein
MDINGQTLLLLLLIWAQNTKFNRNLLSIFSIKNVRKEKETSPSSSLMF